MMLALGLGGWVAGLFHLITHAFFKSLLFLCSGSVIHAVPHERHAADGRPAAEDADHRLHDAHRLPGDRGVGIPFVDRLQRLPLEGLDRRAGAELLASTIGDGFGWLFFVVPRVRRGDDGVLHVPAVVHDVRRRAARSSSLRSRPRIAARDDRAAGVAGRVCGRRRLDGCRSRNLSVPNLLEQGRTVGTLATATGSLMPDLTVPNEHVSHEWPIKLHAGIIAIYDGGDWPHVPKEAPGTPVPSNYFDPRKGAANYKEHLDEMAYCEELGFDGVVFNEHHYSAYGTMPSPNLIAAALSQRTQRIKIGVLGNILPLRQHPVRVAGRIRHDRLSLRRGG